jgi:PAS domain S-box-containing protein
MTNEDGGDSRDGGENRSGRDGGPNDDASHEREAPKTVGNDVSSELLSYATTVGGADTVDQVYQALADAAEAIFAFRSVVVETEDSGMLSVRAWSGEPPSVAGIAEDEGITGEAFRTGETQFVPDVEADPRVEDLPDSAPKSVISVPIGDHGVFQAGLAEANALDEDDLELAELLASHASQAVERIHSRRQVRESEQRFRKLFELADDAFVLYDLHNGNPERIRHVNAAAESLFGEQEETLQDRSIAQLFDASPELFVPGDDDGSSFVASLADEPADRVFEVTVKPFLRQDGPDAFAIVSDVTEQQYREHTLKQLHDATRRMVATNDRDEIARLVVDAAKDLIELPYVGVFFADSDADVLRPVAVSEDVPEQLRVALEAGESLAWDVYESGEPQLFEDVGTEPNAQNPETEIVQELIHPLGEHGVLLIGATAANVLSSADRDLVRVLATNGNAALDRAKRVQELRERERELRDERNRLAALFENVPNPTASFVIEDGSPIVKSVNPAFERVFGYSEDEISGQDIDEYIVPPDHAEEAEVYNEKLRRGQNINVEVHRLTAYGPKDFLLDVVPFHLDEPNVQGYAMYTDITERKERERELERQNDRLEEFAGIVSHDLRNPLNVARGYLELAEETHSEEHFERTEDALERMHDIIESVLTLARQGRSLDETTAVSLEDAAERAWQNVDTADATLEVVDETTLAADPTRFGSLLENLFRNAIEHGGEAVTITVGTTESGFYVADDGPGIPPERREEVFESGETWSEDGTGFGLAIVEQIADAHNWTVRLGESESGGARFVFEV